MQPPDFEKETADAARFDGSVQVRRFSWSYSRERLFRRCRRAYFIGCFLPQGGWDPMAHPVIRSAYVEKQRLSFRLWLSRAVRNGITEGLKKALGHPVEQRRKLFSSGCLRSFSKELFELEYSMEHEEYLNDPKRPCIRECLGKGPESFSERRQQAMDSFGTAYKTLISSPLIRELLLQDPIRFRFQDDLLSMPWKRWTVWFSPGLVFFDGRRFNMLLCSASDFSGETEEIPEEISPLPDPPSVTAALFDLHVRTVWKGAPPLARLFRFDSGHAEVEEIRPADGVEALIDSGAEEMFSLIRPDGTVFFGDFPKASESARCGTCQYAETCRLLDRWEEGRHC